MNEGKLSSIREKLSDFLTVRYRYYPEIANETFVRVMGKIEAGVDIGDSLEAYAVGVAKNVSREFARVVGKIAHSVEDVAMVEPEEPVIPSTELKELMRRVLVTTERELFDAYFYAAKNIPAHRERLARRLGVTMEVLYKRVSRLKTRLTEAHKAGKQAGPKG